MPRKRQDRPYGELGRIFPTYQDLATECVAVCNEVLSDCQHQHNRDEQNPFSKICPFNNPRIPVPLSTIWPDANLAEIERKTRN